MGIVRRVGAVLLVVALLVMGLAPRAQAMTVNDPWVPPSVASHDGLASAVLAAGGAGVPLAAGDPADVRLVSGDGRICMRHIPSWGWTGLSLTMTIERTGDPYCDANSYYTWGEAVFGCLVTTRWYDAVGNVWREVGTVTTRGSSWYSDSRTQTTRTLSNFQCADPAFMTLWWVNIPQAWDTMSQDGLLTYVPGVAALVPPVVSAVTTCSDGSTVTVTAASGALVHPAPCVTGVLVSVKLYSGSQPLGSTTVDPAFRGNPCLAADAHCLLRVTDGAGVTCLNTDSTCAYWGGTSSASVCRWVPDPTGDGWLIPSSDCDQARHDGFDVPPDTPTASPSPSHDPSPPPDAPPDGTPAIVSAVEAAARAVAQAVSDANEAANAAAAAVGHALGDAVAGVGEAVAGIPTTIMRAVVPDAGTMAGLVGEAKGALGAPLGPWTDALHGIAAAWSGSSGGCQGPAFPMPSGVGTTLTLYPLSACAEPFASMASLARIGGAVLLLTGAVWTCVRNLASALGYNA